MNAALSSPSGQKRMPTWGTGVAWQEEVLDPRNSERTLKVSRSQLQCIASLWGQDHQPPKEKDRESKGISGPCHVSPSLVVNHARYLIPEQLQRETHERGWPCTPPR